MSRSLTPSAIGIVTSEIPSRTVAVALDFASGWVRFNGSMTDISIGGDIYIGVGGLGAISVTEESAELRSYDMTVQLSGIPRDAVALGLTETYQGRVGMVWEVPLDPVTGIPVDPFIIFRGRMDMFGIEVGETATATVTLQNRLVDWERPRILRYTDEDQQRLYPGDLGMQFVPATVEKQIVWPAAAWWDRQR